jgi:hypothetical protein
MAQDRTDGHRSVYAVVFLQYAARVPGLLKDLPVFSVFTCILRKSVDRLIVSKRCGVTFKGFRNRNAESRGPLFGGAPCRAWA